MFPSNKILAKISQTEFFSLSVNPSSSKQLFTCINHSESSIPLAVSTLLLKYLYAPELFHGRPSYSRTLRSNP